MADPTTAQRDKLAKLGLAMPDGSYYIRNGSVGASDLDNAIKAVGRGQEDSHNAIRVHIMKRAKDLGLSDKIPADWQADGSLKHSDDPVDDFLRHFGVKGQKWGVRRPRGSGSASSHPLSIDAARAKTTQDLINKHGLKAVSTEDLQHLVSRQNLEKQHGQLNEAHVSAGKKIVDGIVKDAQKSAQKEASKLVAEYAAKGATIVGREIARQALGTRSGVGRHV